MCQCYTEFEFLTIISDFFLKKFLRHFELQFFSLDSIFLKKRRIILYIISQYHTKIRKKSFKGYGYLLT